MNEPQLPNTLKEDLALACKIFLMKLEETKYERTAD